MLFRSDQSTPLPRDGRLRTLRTWVSPPLARAGMDIDIYEALTAVVVSSVDFPDYPMAVRQQQECGLLLWTTGSLIAVG